MDDYISRDAALEDVCADCSEKMRSLCELESNYCKKYNAIKSTPAADVRPVVLCRDCIYDDNCFAQSIFEEMSRIPFDKNRFFCADGERREGGTP